MILHTHTAVLRVTQLVCVSLSIAAVAIVAACGTGDDGPPDKITGFITEVRLDSRDQASFIKLRDREERIWELPIEFDPGSEVTGSHLQQHKSQLLPVVVYVRESDSGLYAARIEDVPP